MNTELKITILGCGASYGVPTLLRGFGDCDPKNPKNTRLRTSILIQSSWGNILVDTGPDIRQQLLKAGNPKIDAVLFTHLHYDHTGGLNEMVRITDIYEKEEDKRTIPLYIYKEDVDSFIAPRSYLFGQGSSFEIKPFDMYIPFEINGLKIIPLLQYHGRSFSTGFRIGNFAYSTDVKKMDPRGFDLLQ
ncbi:MAG: MBL fold metallo-hydrolase, partial [Lactobacillales bacterium]|nr:MBL fold metallo-hydrolase [Lactobacillales bacterium]